MATTAMETMVEEYSQVQAPKDLKQKTLAKFASDLGIDSTNLILWSLADQASLDPAHTKMLISVLQNNNDDIRSLLNPKMGEYDRPPLHHAIERKNFPFLDRLIAPQQVASQELSDLSVEIVIALRGKNPEQYSFTCLHASIRAKLPCVVDMVTLCALVEAEESKLRRVAKQIHDDTDKNEKVESIFLMRDIRGNTPLHLVMESLGNGMKRKSTTSGEYVQYDPMQVIDAMEKACDMAALWTAINDAGYSPYKYLLKNIGKVRSDAERPQDFQEQIRAKVFGALNDIPLLKRALYGTRGTYVPMAET